MERSLLTLGAALAIVSYPQSAMAQSVQSVPVSEASNIEIARQIVDLGYPKDTRETLFFATMDQTVSQMRLSALSSFDLKDEGAIAILDNWMAEYITESKAILRAHIPNIMEGIALAYANMFSRQELADILQFVSTSSGQRFFELSPAILAEPNFAAANQAYMDESMSNLPAATTRLREQLQEYYASIEEAALSSDS